MNTIIFFLIKALDIYLWLIIANIMVSWLVVFNVLNTRNKWAQKFCDILYRVTMPGMNQLRRFIPPLGGIDLTPMAMILIIYLVQGFLYNLYR